jgi:RimJ/RimL family protein N-acetyltransferase
MVQIKEFDLQNVSVHYKWNNDKELNYYDSDYPHQHESFETFLKRIKSVLDERNETNDLFEIHLAENDKLIGIVDIHAIDKYNRRCFVNCTIGDRDYAGKGYDVEALKIVLAHCFEQKNMHKVATTAFDFNTSWIESVKELGFKQEGQLREHVIKQDEYCDKLIFGLLKSDYETTESEVPAAAE